MQYEHIEKLRGLLEEIRDFGHTPDCRFLCAPVHECGCYKDRDERAIAEEALNVLDALERDRDD